MDDSRIESEGKVRMLVFSEHWFDLTTIREGFHDNPGQSSCLSNLSSCLS